MNRLLIQYLIYFFNFDLNLVYDDTISKQPYFPISVHEFNNILYAVERNTEKILLLKCLLIVNKQIITIFSDVCNGNGNAGVINIIFDQFNNVLTSCAEASSLYMYFSNGTFMGKSFPTLSTPMYTGFDANGYLVISTPSQVYFYNQTIYK